MAGKRSTRSTLPLKEEVRQELLKRKGNPGFHKISRISGWSYSSLHQFASGVKDNPSYDRLKRLAELFASGEI